MTLTKIRKGISNAFAYITLAVLGLVWVLPIAYLVYTALRVTPSNTEMRSINRCANAVSFSCACWRSQVVSTYASAKPKMDAVFSVPPRIPRSCSPPATSFSIFTPFLMYNKPMPFGPPSLCAEMDNRSTPSSSTCTG